MNRFVIIGASSQAPSEKLLSALCENARVILADVDPSRFAALESGVFARIGDFDSAEAASGEPNTVLLPPEKDFTDLHAAAMLAADNGADEVIMAGCTGGRLDHFWSAAGILEYLSERGVNACIADDCNLIFYQNGGKRYYGDLGYRYFSLVPLDCELFGVTLEGLKYPLKDASLRRAGSLGVSNEFISDEASVVISKGAALAVYSDPSPVIPREVFL